MRVLIWFAVLLSVGMGAAFAIRPLTQPILDDEARRALTKSGAINAGVALREMRSMTMTVAGRTAHIRIADPGEGGRGTVILIHGFSTPSYVFRDYFVPLSEAGYLVAAPDLYGRGFSDRLDVPYSEEVFTGEIMDLIAALKSDAPIHLVGYSMGAAIALRLAAANPDKIRTLTLIAPAGFDCGGSLENFFTAPVIGDWLFTVLGPEIVERRRIAEWNAMPDAKHWIEAHRQHAHYRGFGPALLSTLRDFPFADSCSAAKAFSLSGKPVLMIWGEADTTMPMALQANAKRLMPNASFVTLPGRGHGLTFQNSGEVIPELMKLFESDAH